MSEQDIPIGTPITWDGFMLLPREKQEALLKYITNRFGVGTSAIANDLFHVSQHTLYRYIRRQGLEYPMSHGGRIPDAVLREWKKWVENLSAANNEAIFDGGSADVPASADAADAERIDSAADSVGDVVRTMHDLYGKVRVTIAIEPI